MTKQNPDKTEAEQKASEANPGVIKERVAGVLGGALSRIFERAGLDVRITSPATQPSAQAAAPSSSLPGRDALLTLATAVLAERLLSRHAAEGVPASSPAPSREPTRAAAPSPPMACDRISDLLGPAVVDPTARPAPRAASPAVVTTAETRSRAAAAESASGAPVAPVVPAAAAPPSAEKRRGFTLRY